MMDSYLQLQAQDIVECYVTFVDLHNIQSIKMQILQIFEGFSILKLWPIIIP